MKSLIGRVTLVAIVGSVLGTSVVYASGGQMVSAQSGVSSVFFNGQRVSSPPKLVYGGTTYVQLYSIELALRQAGMKPSWDGTNFSFTNVVSDSNLKSLLDKDMTAFVSIVNTTNSDNTVAGTDYAKKASDAAQAKSQLQSLFVSVERLSVAASSYGEQTKQDAANAIQTEILVQKIYENAMKDAEEGNVTDSNQKIKEALDLRVNYEADYINQYDSDRNHL